MTYLAVLGFIVVGSGWLELLLSAGVLRRWRRLLLTVVPVVVVFMTWDAYAVSRGHWTFSPTQITGIELPAGIPLEELLFFLAVPLAAILTWEAVCAVRGTDPRDGRAARPALSLREALATRGRGYRTVVSRPGDDKADG